MPIIGGEVLIFRPRGAVFDFVADERHEPAFNPRMTQVQLVSGEPLGTGSRMSATASSFGSPADMTIESTTFERPSRLGSRTTMASMIIDGELTFKQAPGGTHLRWFPGMSVRPDSCACWDRSSLASASAKKRSAGRASNATSKRQTRTRCPSRVSGAA